MRALAALLCIVALAPGAAACSYAMPNLLQEVAWFDDGTLVGSTELFRQGRIDLDNGTVRSEFPSDAHVSPDRRYLVFARVGPDVQTGPSRIADSCGGELSRHLVAYDRTEERFVLVARGPVWGFSSTEDGVLAFDGDMMHVLEWGSWRALRSEPAPRIVEPLRFSGSPTLSPDTTHYVDWNEGALVSIDGKSSRSLKADALHVTGAAFSPNGPYLAVNVDIDASTSELRIFSLPDAEIVARERTSSRARLLSWGAGGIMTTEVGEDARTLRIWPDAPAPGARVARTFGAELAGVAWRPDGLALAVALSGSADSARLLILDPELRDVESHEIALAPSQMERWDATLARQVPTPDYSTSEKLQATPGGGAAFVVLAMALAFVVISRRLPWRGTSRGPRP